VLVILIIFGCIIYAISLIFKGTFNKMRGENYEQEIFKVVDMIMYYQENKHIENTDELLKHIHVPKNMKITKENNEIIIYYKNLTYNVNTGRYLEK